jgi:hypothetical protein
MFWQLYTTMDNTDKEKPPAELTTGGLNSYLANEIK